MLPLGTRYTVGVRLPSSITTHGIAAIAAIVAVIAVSQGVFRVSPGSFLAQLSPKESVEIGVEHTQPMSLSLSVTTEREAGIADISHDAKEAVFLSVPSTWIRREVRGAALSAVTSETPTFGFTRWQLPAGSVISFALPASPSAILLHNPSGVSLQVKVTRVDLEKKTVDRNIVLVKDTSVELW